MINNKHKVQVSVPRRKLEPTQTRRKRSGPCRPEIESAQWLQHACVLPIRIIKRETNAKRPAPLPPHSLTPILPKVPLLRRCQPSSFSISLIACTGHSAIVHLKSGHLPTSTSIRFVGARRRAPGNGVYCMLEHPHHLRLDTFVARARKKNENIL